ncbi:MAG: class I SAM-dependent methyltransferase, partial [Candidatus Micrarchaeota archaeon]
MPNERKMLFIASGLFLERAMGAVDSRSNRYWRDRGIETRNSLPRALVLDMCCGTGNFSNQVSLMHPKIEVTGIDLNQKFVAFAKEKYGGLGWTFVNGDAVTYKFTRDFDFVLMSSAYHHIEDEQKAAFLINARNHMKQTGICILCDNFLPAYTGKDGKR